MCLIHVYTFYHNYSSKTVAISLVEKLTYMCTVHVHLSFNKSAS